MFDSKCRAKKLDWTVRWELPPTGGLPLPPIVVRGDEQKLRQILINLLGNAVKFTEKGSVTLEIRTPGIPDDPEGATQIPCRWRFEVIDTGIGISPDAHSDIFKPFQQAEGGVRAGGTGLGLAIAKRLIDLMDGRIGMASTPGEGARFWIELPLDRPAQPSASLAKAIQHSNPRLKVGTRIKALVVDDILENREVLSRMLAQLGCEVLTADDGESGVDVVLREHPDIVFMDIRMPGIDGVEAVKRIRNRSADPGTPEISEVKVVCLSASALAHEQERYLSVGFDDFIAKPFRFERITECLVALLDAEFQEVKESGASAQPRHHVALADIKLDAALWQSLHDAAERCSATRLEQSAAAIEKLGTAGEALAAQFRIAAQANDFEGILDTLSSIRRK